MGNDSDERFMRMVSILSKECKIREELLHKLCIHFIANFRHSVIENLL